MTEFIQDFLLISSAEGPEFRSISLPPISPFIIPIRLAAAMATTVAPLWPFGDNIHTRPRDLPSKSPGTEKLSTSPRSTSEFLDMHMSSASIHKDAQELSRIKANPTEHLHRVVGEGSIHLLKELLESEDSLPLNVNCKDATGRSALHYASLGGYEDCVTLLLNHGANPTIKTGNSGENAITIASKAGHEGCVRLLQEHEEDARTKSNLGSKTTTLDSHKYGSSALDVRGWISTVMFNGMRSEHASGSVYHENCLVSCKGRYNGESHNGKMHGKGLLRITEGTLAGCIYSGYFQEGKMHGTGIQLFADGALYEGDYVNGMKHGKGTYRFENGDMYSGELKNSKQNGKGTMRFADGSLYEGDFVDGLKHGSGVMWNTDRSVYKGEFKSDQRHGQGIEWSSSGVRRIVDNNMRLFGFRTSMPQGLGARTQMTEPALAPPRPAPLANQSLLF